MVHDANQSCTANPSRTDASNTYQNHNDTINSTVKNTTSKGNLLRRRRRLGPLSTTSPGPMPSASNQLDELGRQDSPPKKSSVQLNERLNIILAGSEGEGNEDRAGTAAVDSNKESRQDGLLKPQKLGVFEFVWMELTRGYSLQEERCRYKEKRRKVYAFVRVFFELEKIFVDELFGCIARLKDWTAADTSDILKILIILSSSWLLQFLDQYTKVFDVSVLYHLVRGQSVIKLYIGYNMLEVVDKLLSSFGQDILDALLWTASEKGGTNKLFKTVAHLLAAIVYAILHTFIILLQATTLNVAFNSHNQSLLTIMMSNNFVELKGSVFKKFAKPNLFQMSCSDVRERFHTVILLVVVVLRNMTGVNWNIDTFNEMLPDLAMVVFAEVLVDWLKHAFITKFNEISADVYKDFTITLAFDVVRSHEKVAFSDFSDQVSRRMGFIPIPISIMLIQVIRQSIDFNANFYVLVFLLVWCLLCSIKVLTGVFLHRRAVDQIMNYRNLLSIAEQKSYRIRILSAKSKSAPGSPRLSLIDFSDVLTQAPFPPSKVFTVYDEPVSSLRHRHRSRNEPSESGEQSMQNSPVPENTPRRCQSMVDFRKEQKREQSLPPPPIPEGEERVANPPTGQSESSETCKDNTPARSQASPKRRTQVDLFQDVQAYTMLNGSEPVQDIQP
uniref:Protein TAPT1 homolog n=1 Tax=Ditylenchus dipsaci TaxID=166011 RepID=A0A915CLW1_9BILA